MYPDRVVSGMRPTGVLHLGHYHGALKNWVRLQYDYECLFFVADWHALTTHYDDRGVIEKSVWDMVIDWLAAGIDPAQATLFIQTGARARRAAPAAVDDHAAGLAGAGADLQGPAEKLEDRDLATYGFLGYPLLQAADMLIYRASMVPVGEDQVPHIEITREWRAASITSTARKRTSRKRRRKP